MARLDAVLHRGTAVPRQDRARRFVLDRGAVRRRLVNATRAVVVPARALAKPSLHLIPLRLDVAAPGGGRFRLGEPQADCRHKAPGNLVREQRNWAQFNNVARFHAAPELLAEIVSECYLGVIGGGILTKKRSSACAFSGGARR